MGRAQEPAWSKHAAQVLSRGQRDQVTQQMDSPPIPRAPFPLHALAGPNHPGRSATSCGQNYAVKNLLGSRKPGMISLGVLTSKSHWGRHPMGKKLCWDSPTTASDGWQQLHTSLSTPARP